MKRCIPIIFALALVSCNGDNPQALEKAWLTACNGANTAAVRLTVHVEAGDLSRDDKAKLRKMVPLIRKSCLEGVPSDLSETVTIMEGVLQELIIIQGKAK